MIYFGYWQANCKYNVNDYYHYQNEEFFEEVIGVFEFEDGDVTSSTKKGSR
jgi:hypothetical protein